MCVCVCVCVCVGVCVWKTALLCGGVRAVCVCVCVWKRQGLIRMVERYTWPGALSHMGTMGLEMLQALPRP